MSNASLKEQLQAVASQLNETLEKEQKPKARKRNFEKTNFKSFNTTNTNTNTNTNTKPKWLDYVQYGVELLKVYFPASFMSVNSVKPLKKGIKQDLVKRLSMLEGIVTEDKACMVKSLAYYVNTIAYHRSVVEGAVRIDLDGNSADVVSAEEAKYSTLRHQAKLLAKQNAKSRTQQYKNISKDSSE